MLQEIATTPLMLSILILTYQGQAASTLPVTGSLPEQQRQIFATYVERMIERKAKSARVPHYNFVSCLAWLARQMRQHRQTIFYLEHLQPDWLSPRYRRRYRWSAVLLPGIVIGALASVLIQLLFNTDFPITLLTFQLALFFWIVLGGFLGGVVNESVSAARDSPPQAHNQSHQHSKHSFGRHLTVSLLIGLMGGLSYWVYFRAFVNGTSYTLNDVLREGCISGGMQGLSCLLLSIWVPLLTSGSASSHDGTGRTWKRFISLLRTVHGQRALLIAVLMGIGDVLTDPRNWLIDGLSYWILLGLFQGIVREQIENRSRQVPNQGIRHSLRNSVIMGLISEGESGRRVSSSSSSRYHSVCNLWAKEDKHSAVLCY